MNANKWLFWTSLGISLFVCISLFCFSKIARKFPLNYIALGIFTVFSAYLIASICIFQEPQNVMIAACLTLTVFISLTILTFFVSNSGYYINTIIIYIRELKCINNRKLYMNSLSTSLPIPHIFMMIFIMFKYNRHDLS